MARQLLTIAAYWSEVPDDWQEGETGPVADECAELLRDSKEEMRIRIGSVVTFRPETIDPRFRQILRDLDLAELANHKIPEEEG